MAGTRICALSRCVEDTRSRRTASFDSAVGPWQMSSARIARVESYFNTLCQLCKIRLFGDSLTRCSD